MGSKWGVFIQMMPVRIEQISVVTVRSVDSQAPSVVRSPGAVLDIFDARVDKSCTWLANGEDFHCKPPIRTLTLTGPVNPQIRGSPHY